MAARTSPASSSELTVVMYIIYTNLNPRQQNVSSSSNKNLVSSTNNNNRMANSLKTNSNINQTRERSATILLPLPTKTNLVVPVRSNSVGSEQTIGNNIPTDRTVE